MFRIRKTKTNPAYRNKICVPCEREDTLKHQQENREYWRNLNKEFYKKSSEGQVSRRNVMDRDAESKAEWARDKSNRRCSRAKEAKMEWNKELTDFVYAEAHDLRKRRNKLTGFEWHVDHIIPLKGKLVSGLHVWNNFRVIPKVLNLRKGNNHSISKERQTRL